MHQNLRVCVMGETKTLTWSRCPTFYLDVSQGDAFSVPGGLVTQ